MNLETAFFVVEAMEAADTGAGATVEDIARGSRHDPRTTRRHMRMLEAFNLAQVIGVGPRETPRWSLTEAGQALLRAARG